MSQAETQADGGTEVKEIRVRSFADVLCGSEGCDNPAERKIERADGRIEYLCAACTEDKY